MSFLLLLLFITHKEKKDILITIAKKEHDWKNFCFLKISAKNNNNFLI